MSAKAEFFAILGATLTALGLICAYLLPAWKERRKADAAEREAQAVERQAVAAFMSEQVQAGLRVLTGDPGNPAQGIEPTPGLGKRVASIESQMRPNGGGSMRDVLNRIHDVAIENSVANAETQALAGEAATVAATTDQRVRELAAQQAQQHQENVARLDAIEDNAEGAAILRELYLNLLRDKHGIDLRPDEGDDDGGGG